MGVCLIGAGEVGQGLPSAMTGFFGLPLIAAGNGAWLETVVGLLMAVIALGVVVFVHELGHFVVAKMCGVKCLKFYVGFDPPLAIGFGKYKLRLPSAIWKKQWGETEYGIGVIPLGGYVRMLGQDDNPTHEDESAVVEGGDGSTPAQLDPRNYQAKSVPQRMAIISAGVVMNVIFAFIFALAAVYIGVKYTPCIVAQTQPGDPAWRQGVLPGDEIMEINGVKYPRFTDLQQQVLLADADEGLKVVIRRPGVAELIHLTIKPDSGYLSAKEQPRLGVAMKSSLELRDGMPVHPFSPVADFPEGAGFLGGDTIVAVNGEPIANSMELEAALVKHVDEPIDVTVQRKIAAPAGSADVPPSTKNVTLTVSPNPWRDLGLTMTMGPINAVRENSPAQRAASEQVEGGIRRGDRIVTINGKPVGDPMTLPMRMRAFEGKEVRLTVERRVKGKAETDPPQLYEFTTTLDMPDWSPDGAFPNSPAAFLALGVTYVVDAKVAAPPTGSASGKGINAGDTVTRVEFVPQKDPQTEDEKEEAKSASLIKAIEFAPDKPSWPMVMWFVQQIGPDTGVKLTLKSEKGARTVTLYADKSPEFFEANRGFALRPNLVPLEIESFGEAVVFAGRETKSSLLQVVLFLKKMTRGDVSPTTVAGPISIFRIAAHFANQGLGQLLLFLTLLSANLAVLNFLPIPVLDGGHMVFLTLEAIFRRPVPRRISEPLTWAGAVMLLSLMLFTTVLDVQRLFNWL